MSSYQNLKAALAAEHYQGLTDQQAAALLAADHPTPRLDPMRVGDFGNWLAARGLLRAVVQAMTHDNPYVASAATLLDYKLSGDPGRLVDPQAADIQGMFAAFLAAGLVAQTDIDAFAAACEVHDPRWRVETTWGYPPNANDVAVARAL